MRRGEVALVALEVPDLVVDGLDVGVEVSVVVGGVVAFVARQGHDLAVLRLGVKPKICFRFLSPDSSQIY